MTINNVGLAKDESLVVAWRQMQAAERAADWLMHLGARAPDRRDMFMAHLLPLCFNGVQLDCMAMAMAGVRTDPVLIHEMWKLVDVVCNADPSNVDLSKMEQ